VRSHSQSQHPDLHKPCTSQCLLYTVANSDDHCLEARQIRCIQGKCTDRACVCVELLVAGLYGGEGFLGIRKVTVGLENFKPIRLLFFEDSITFDT